MNLHIFLPSTDLSHIIDGIWVQEQDSDTGGRAPLTIMPGTSAVMCVQYRDPVHGAGQQALYSAFTGIQTQSRDYFPTGETGAVVLRFTPWGAAMLLGNCMHDTADVHVSLATLFGRLESERLEQQIADGGNAAGRAGILQSFVRRHCRYARDRLAERAALLLHRHQGALPVGELARQLTVSERQLQRRFPAAIGLSPKQFARILRFQHALRRRCFSGDDWACIAQLSGYTDQSHLIRDFRRFAGRAPDSISRLPTGRLARFFGQARGTSGFNDLVYL